MTVHDVRLGLEAPKPLSLDGTALFLDLDGTLAPIAARPQDVGPDPRRTSLVQRLSAAVGGRLAVVSGRTLCDVDRILEDGVRPVAAVHGLVRRRADGRIEEMAPHPCLGLAREAFAELARAAPGLLLEDKAVSVALHYRLAPEKAGEVQAAAARLAEETGLKRQDGAMVCELRTPGPSKGDSVRAFLAERPFQDAAPVFLGDDITDEDGFHAVAALGGYGVLVGASRRTRAAFRLQSVDEALTWLEGAL